MKRIGWLMMMVLCLGWGTGCAATAPTPPVTHSFVCTLSVTGLGDPISGDLSVADGVLSWSLTTPATVNGCTLTTDGETLTLSQPNGEPLTLAGGILPPSGVIPTLWGVLHDTAGTLSAGQQTGRVKGGAYTLTFDPQSGRLRTLSVADAPWHAEFADR